MKNVREAMTTEPISIAPDVELNDAWELMRSWGMRHLPVTDSSSMVVGLLSERDILRFKALHPEKKRAATREAMTSAPFVVTPDASLADVAKEMAESKYGCAVVAGPKGIVGIFTTTDALKILSALLHEDDPAPFRIMRIEEYLRTRAS